MKINLFPISSKDNYSNNSDEELLELIIKGKELAFNELYKRYAQKMLSFFSSKLNNDVEKANDFVQNLFLKLIENPRSFNKAKKFLPWFYTIAYNMCKNEYRRIQNKKIVQDYNLENIIDSNLQLQDNTTFITELEKKLKELSEVENTTFILRHQQNFTIKEISEIMNCSEGTVKSRLFYSIRKLSQKLKKFHPIL